MTRDANVPDMAAKCDVHVWIRLRYSTFEQATALLGATTDTARADLVGTTRRQIRRMRQGEPVGEALIARILVTFRRNATLLDAVGIGRDFNDLFELVEEGQLVQRRSA